MNPSQSIFPIEQMAEIPWAELVNSQPIMDSGQEAAAIAVIIMILATVLKRVPYIKKWDKDLFGALLIMTGGTIGALALHVGDHTIPWFVDFMLGVSATTTSMVTYDFMVSRNKKELSKMKAVNGNGVNGVIVEEKIEEAKKTTNRKIKKRRKKSEIGFRALKK